MNNMKILSILSIFLMLTATVVSAATTAEQKQDSRLTALESNVKKILTRLTALEYNVKKILTRLTNLESNPYPAIYTTSQIYTQLPINNQEYTLDNLTFVLPKAAYVNVQGDGMITSWLGYAYTNLVIDGQGGQVVWYGSGNYNGSGERTGFEKSEVRYLSAGTHTAKVVGLTYGSVGTAVAWAKISAVAYDKGSIQ
jgi:hypothetical protein